MSDHFTWAGDVKRLTRKPGDVFVITCRTRVTREMADQIKVSFRDALGDDLAQVIVMDSACTLGVVEEQ